VDQALGQLTAEERKAQRRRKRLIVVATILLVPTVLIYVVNHIDTDVPPPLWTEADLPIPAEAENGWTSIKHYDSMTISGIDLEPIDKLLAAARDGTPLADLGRLFQPARVVAAKIREHTAICSQAFERKRLVIPCISLDTHACTTEPVDICSQLASFAALDDTARGSPSGAALMANVIRRLTDAAANSPHAWMQARLLLSLRRAIHHGAVIIKWRRADAEPVRASLRAITDETLPVKHLVVASYLIKHMALRQALERTDTWLLDEGDIVNGLNAAFEAAARGGSLAPPPDHTTGLFWWFDNPVGKRMLDAVQPGADKDFVRTSELRASVLERRDEALKLR
jgi:hypothetical protein